MILLFLTFYIKYIKDFLQKLNNFKIRMNLNQLNQLKNSSFAIKKMIIASSLKIFLNYSQTITILNSLNLNWEGKLLDIFNIHKAASGGFQEVLSLECLFTGICIDYSVLFKFSLRFECNPLLQTLSFNSMPSCHLLSFRLLLDSI